MNDIETIRAAYDVNTKAISLAQIQEMIPGIEYDDPTLYVLYLKYNEECLNEEETALIKATIEKYRAHQDDVNQKNIEYMERHLKCNHTVNAEPKQADIGFE